MTDAPSQPADESNEIPDESNADRTHEKSGVSNPSGENGGKQEVPPGMLPLVEPTFGKRAFLITAVPFLIYLAGTSIGAHLENIRKTAPAHDMRGICRAMASDLTTALNSSLQVEPATEILNRIDMPNVKKALDDESAEVAKLVQDCDKLLNANFDDLPPQIGSALVRFQDYVRHFFELEAMVEENEIDGIRAAHATFVASQGAGPLPELNESWYPTLYSVACIAAFIAVLIAMPGYLKIPFRISPFAIGIGVIGIFVWLGLWWLDKNLLHIGSYFAPNSRAAFNPWVELADNPTWMYTFVGIRLLGLCLVIPIAEEFFSRGFLMRYIEDIDWDQIPIGEATWKGIVGILAYGAMTHPGEIVAALAWFGLITWMYLKTKNIWDCVVAHAVTNSLLAAYVLATDTWELW